MVVAAVFLSNPGGPDDCCFCCCTFVEAMAERSCAGDFVVVEVVGAVVVVKLLWRAVAAVAVAVVAVVVDLASAVE